MWACIGFFLAIGQGVTILDGLWYAEPSAYCALAVSCVCVAVGKHVPLEEVFPWWNS